MILSEEFLPVYLTSLSINKYFFQVLLPNRANGWFYIFRHSEFEYVFIVINFQNLFKLLKRLEAESYNIKHKLFPQNRLRERLHD